MAHGTVSCVVDLCFDVARAVASAAARVQARTCHTHPPLVCGRCKASAGGFVNVTAKHELVAWDTGTDAALHAAAASITHGGWRNEARRNRLHIPTLPASILCVSMP